MTRSGCLADPQNRKIYIARACASGFRCNIPAMFLAPCLADHLATSGYWASQPIGINQTMEWLARVPAPVTVDRSATQYEQTFSEK
jgi:hypothetical protein